MRKVKTAKESFPKNPHNEQTHCIQGNLSEDWIKEADKHGWKWVCVSYHGIRFMYLPYKINRSYIQKAVRKSRKNMSSHSQEERNQLEEKARKLINKDSK